MLDEDGFLYLADRKKDIIISGGENIYPGEVENVLLMHNAVDAVAVVGVQDDTWGEKVVAAVVLKENKECSEKTIIDFCKKHIAGFKCPRSLFFLDDLPKNAAQKVMRAELKRIYLEKSAEF